MRRLCVRRSNAGLRTRSAQQWQWYWIAIALALVSSVFGCRESERGPGEIEGSGQSASHVAERARSRGATDTRQILFGDLHVHSTYSIDAFMFALPLFSGEGVHPPADACDFARYCADLDFFSINDHAEGLIPARWLETQESIRQCNALAGDPANPDLVAYLGWEWTQVGDSPETHYGHKNVIFRELDPGRVPTRPITALPDGTTKRARALWALRAAQAVGVVGLQELAHFLWWIEAIARTPDCPRGVDTRELPPDCRENADTPRELFEKLDQWGFDALVIPHGLAWGVHAPPGARLDNQLSMLQHDPDRQRLLEIHSGHGNSEEFRDVPEFETAGTGEQICAPPSADYLPCCWRAGQLVRERCEDATSAECEERVREAQQLALEAGVSPYRVLPDTEIEDWLDCDQCRDCFKPAANLRPGETAQYGAALANLSERDADGAPLRYRWGFISSTDNHSARPGTGYKQFDRRRMTDTRGLASPWDRWLRSWIRGTQEDPDRAQAAPREERGFRSLFDVERESSFMYPGGIVGVHAEGRDRDALWKGLMRREVYGTSGPRILLWFDLLNAPNGRLQGRHEAGLPARPQTRLPARPQTRLPMGSETVLAYPPRFEARAVGSFVQEPGCPERSVHALSSERLENLCGGECYHPSEQRHLIEAIEVIRIRVQERAGEPVAPLIEDPWLRLPCEPNPEGCVVRFEDPDHGVDGRDHVYYVRALQQETPAINAGTLRTRFEQSAEGSRAVSVDPCHGNDRTPASDDCLAPIRERAWSSPIYVDRSR